MTLLLTLTIYLQRDFILSWNKKCKSLSRVPKSLYIIAIYPQCHLPNSIWLFFLDHIFFIQISCHFTFDQKTLKRLNSLDLFSWRKKKIIQKDGNWKQSSLNVRMRWGIWICWRTDFVCWAELIVLWVLVARDVITLTTVLTWQWSYLRFVTTQEC